MLALDKKETDVRKLPLDERDAPLTEDEKRGLLYVSYYYPAFPV